MNINIINKAKASRIAGVNPCTIYEWAKKGKINKYYVLGRKTFKVSELEVRQMKQKTFVN